MIIPWCIKTFDYSNQFVCCWLPFVTGCFIILLLEQTLMLSPRKFRYHQGSYFSVIPPFVKRCSNIRFPLRKSLGDFDIVSFEKIFNDIFSNNISLADVTVIIAMWVLVLTPYMLCTSRNTSSSLLLSHWRILFSSFLLFSMGV